MISEKRDGISAQWPYAAAREPASRSMLRHGMRARKTFTCWQAWGTARAPSNVGNNLSVFAFSSCVLHAKSLSLMSGLGVTPPTPKQLIRVVENVDQDKNSTLRCN